MFDLIKSLSREEISEFRVFLNSPYLNSSDVIKEIFQKVIRYYPDFDPAKVNYTALSQEKIHDKIYSESEMRAYIAKLNKKLSEFLVLKRFTESDLLQDELMMDILTEKGLKKQFLKINSRYREKIDDRGIEYTNPRNLYKAVSKYFDFAAIYSPILKKADAIEKIKIIEKCRMLSTEDYFANIIADNITYIIYVSEFGNIKREEIITDNNIINFIYENFKEEEKTSLINLYKCLFDSFNNLSDTQNYTRYRNYFFEISPDMNIKERSYHYQNLFTYCSIKRKMLHLYGTGKSLSPSDKISNRNITEKYVEIDFKIESFKLMKYFLESGLYKASSGKYLSAVMILNILKLAGSKKDITWLKNFIESHSDDLKTEDLKSLIVFTGIYKNILGKNYDKAFADLIKIELLNVVFKYEMKILKLRLLYEKNEIENVMDDIHSFHEFVKRDKFLSEFQKLKAGNFTKYLESLCRDNLKEKLKNSYQSLYNEHEVLFKEWLIEKYEEKFK